jgi:hypothetical protein
LPDFIALERGVRERPGFFVIDTGSARTLGLRKLVSAWA